MKFSVLMSIYYKEKPEYFNRAMQSIWDEQTIKPDEIVLVKDGKLTNELYNLIDKWKDKLNDIFKVVSLEENVGLGNALNIGLQNCSYEFVARMDSDDISLPHRFEKQLKIFENSDVDICGAWINEFDTDENKILGERKLPENHNEIEKYAKFRNPLNHPTAMCKKSTVLRAGNYSNMKQAQDYELWARMILNGAKFYNIQEVLVCMRAGHGQLERRSGLQYAKRELDLFNNLRKIGFLSLGEYIKNLIIKIPIRLMPKFIIKLIYKIIRRS